MAWVYEISRGRWNENRDADYLQQRQSLGPRYTHKLVYEEEAGFPFMFGRNPWGIEIRDGKQRLGNFWRLDLQRQQNTDLQRALVMKIRKTQFWEKSTDPMAALDFLQTEVSSCVNNGGGGAAGQQDVSEENLLRVLVIICDHLVPVKVMAQMILNSNAVSNFLLLRCLVRLVSTEPFAKLSQILPERPCRGGYQMEEEELKQKLDLRNKFYSWHVMFSD